MAAPPGERRSIGPYQLEQLLGRGGMAEVYRARREGPGGFSKVLALKRILPTYARDPNLVGRFLDEARLSAHLDHSNLVHVVDFGTVDGEYYLVMEWVDGSNLFAVIRALAEQGLALPPEVTAHVIAEAAAGLEAAHGLCDEAGRPLGLVHRDVSPQNILLSRRGDVKVSDFGIAKALGSSVRTATGVQIGKVCYMSPEQVRQEPLDARADVYALGVVLWECLTGRPLFPRGLDAGALEAVLHPNVAPPSRVSAGAPPALDGVTLRALAPAREARTASAGALGRELRVWLHSASPGFGQSDLAAYLATRLPAPAAGVAPSAAARASEPSPGTVAAVEATVAPPTRREVPRATPPVAESVPPPQSVPPPVDAAPQGAASLVPQRSTPPSEPPTRPDVPATRALPTPAPGARRRGWVGCLLVFVATGVLVAAGLGLCAWRLGLFSLYSVLSGQ